MKYYINNKKEYNNTIEENKNKNEKLCTEIFVSCPYKTRFKEPLYNPSTFEKDIKILDQYGSPFYSFFLTNNTSILPMFTFPPQPKSVKRVTVDKTFTLNANTTGYIQIFPFSKNMLYSQNGTTAEHLLTNDQLNCFVKYKVVCCKIMIKQIGIMHLSDGYGTAFDAVMTAASSSFNYLKENLLSVQTAPGRKVMLVDGRNGLEAYFLGSPNYDYNYNFPSTFEPNMFVKAGKTQYPEGVSTYIPANSFIAPETFSSSESYVVLDDGQQIPIGAQTYSFMQPIVKVFACTLAVQVPQGDSLFIRISPPTINVSIKLYIDVVVEGQVKDEYLSNMPQYIPPIPFDFNRIQFAFSNVVPSIRVIDIISSCKTKKLEKTFIYPNKPFIKKKKPFVIAYPEPLKTCREQNLFFESKKSIKTRKRRIKRIKKERLSNYKFDCYYNLVENFDPFETNVCEDISRIEYRVKNAFRENLNENFSIPFERTFRNDSLDYKRLKDNKERGKVLLSFCSQKAKQVKRLTTIQRFSNIVNPIELPDYLKEACLFTGEVVTMLKSSQNSNRLFRDSFTPLPFVSFQYFPAITNEEEVYPALVAVKLGLFGGTKTVYKVPLAESGKDTDLTISYFPDQFDSEQEFLDVLDTVVSYCYGKLFHYCPAEGFTIKFFGKGKFKDTSYMLALTAAIFGVPSGGFYTGAFTEKEGKFEAVEIDREVIEAKLKISSPDFPLTVLSKNLDNGTNINTISGGIPSYEGGKLMPTSDINSASIYMMTPFTIRGYKKTPLSEKSADAKRYLTEQMTSNTIKYIVFSNIDSIQKYETLNKEIPYKYYSRANPENYTCYVLKSGRISDASEFYDTYPELLEEGQKFWSFEYKDTLYVEKNAFLSDIRRMKYKGTIKGDRTTINKYDNENKKILNIGEKDVDNQKDKMWEILSKKDSGKNRKIELEEVSKENLTRELNQKDLEKLSQFEGIIIDGLTALYNLLANNPPTSKSSKPSVEGQDFRTLFGILKLPSNTNKELELTKTNEWKYFKMIYDVIGSGGIYTAANIFGWVENPQSKFKSSTLQKLYEGLNKVYKLKLPKLDLPNEDEKTEEIKENVKRRVDRIKKGIKRTNKGPERSERLNESEEEDEKEEKPVSRKKKQKERLDEVYDFFENGD